MEAWKALTRWSRATLLAGRRYFAVILRNRGLSDPNHTATWDVDLDLDGMRQYCYESPANSDYGVLPTKICSILPR